MKNDLKDLLGKSVEEVIKSPKYTLSILRIYSRLFLNNGQPGSCESSIRKYYSELKSKGIEIMKKLEKTNVANFTGVKFVPSVIKDGEVISFHRHINPDLLDDLEAIELLNYGALKESDFIKLPDGYLKKQNLINPQNVQVPEISKPEIKIEVEKEKSNRGRKPKK